MGLGKMRLGKRKRIDRGGRRGQEKDCSSGLIPIVFID